MGRGRHQELDSGRFPDLPQAVRRSTACEPARKCVQYLRNRDKMRYLQFEAEGLCTSSGVVEGGCKVATVRGSNALALHKTARRVIRSRGRDTCVRIPTAFKVRISPIVPSAEARTQLSNATSLDAHYEPLRAGMRDLFDELGFAA